MPRYNIIDFDRGVGGLTNGMERIGDFEVVGAPWLNSDNNLCYNLNHNKLFEMGEDYNGYNVAVFNPDFGKSFARRGRANFQTEDVDFAIDFINSHNLSFSVISAHQNVVKLLYDEILSYTGDKYPVYDRIISNIDKKYNVFQFVLSAAAYGLPQNFSRVFYLCINKKDIDFRLAIPKPFNTIKTGFVSIRDGIGDLEDEHYSNYCSDYIKQCRVYRGDLIIKTTWHDLDFKKQNISQHILQNSNAKRTPEVHQKTGYIRPRYDRICPPLRNDFYKVSSKGVSLHPIKNRPLTIREGARLFGLPDTFVWNKELSKKSVANMIYNSIPPIFGFLIAEMLIKGGA